jgi:hypothetical protein
MCRLFVQCVWHLLQETYGSSRCPCCLRFCPTTWNHGRRSFFFNFLMGWVKGHQPYSSFFYFWIKRLLISSLNCSKFYENNDRKFVFRYTFEQKKYLSKVMSGYVEQYEGSVEQSPLNNWDDFISFSSHYYVWLFFRFCLHWVVFPDITLILFLWAILYDWW